MTTQTKINRSDLQFFPSERLTDNDDGGGMPLGTPISGESNELFNPISGIARVNGGFYARLVYMGVQRADDEPLIGSFTAITKPPNDPTVSYLLFPATKFGEQRSEILKRIEAYNVGTIESRMTLLSTQSQNSRLIQAYQRVGEPLPLVGDVYCLRQDKSGYPKIEQYVQVTRVTSEDRTFTNQSNNKDFVRTVVKMEISSKLEADFIGANYPSEGYIDNPCKIRETSVADAAQYYGIKPLAAAIEKDRQTIKIPSLMEKLVPTNQVETFLTDLSAAGQRQTLLDGSKIGDDGIVTFNVSKSHSAGTTTSLYVGNAATPGSISINTNGGTIVDKGGALLLNEVSIGTVTYSAGELLINAPGYTGYINSASFRPAGSELQVADTQRIDITINNRGYGHSANIEPPPAAGSLIVSYRAQGRWYDLRDDGTGSLRGSSAAHGSGNVNLVTGSVQISCGELPDVGSSILLSWGTRARYFNRAGGSATAKMVLELTQDTIPDSIALSWNDGEAKTATANTRGIISGDWTGRYDAATRRIFINADASFNHPAGLLDITVQYSTGARIAITEPLTVDDAGTATFTAPDFTPGSLELTHQLPSMLDGRTFSVGNAIVITDDGAGNLINAAGSAVGTIDYATGAGSFDTTATVQLKKPIYKKTQPLYANSPVGNNSSGSGVIYQSDILTGYEYSTADVALSSTDPNIATIRYFEAGGETGVTETVSSGDIEIDLLPTYAEIVTPSSVNFTWAGKRYFDKNGGIYTNLDPKTGAATFVGRIDYQSAIVTLTDWRWTDGTAPSVKALVTSLSGNPVDTVTFRTPSAPLRAGSLQVRATALDGTRLTATADLSGMLSSAGVNGYVDAEFGVGSVQFGQWMTAQGNESEPWYNADAINADGKIWRPQHVFANSITYNTVSYSYLPIDSTVVKIDTVRLPQDGRIPIFRRGDTIIIGNRQTEDIGSAHTGGQTVQLSRAGVDRIAVSDADDHPISAELWDYDLAAGTITWRTPLDLSMYKMPLKVMHAQEERNRITETDIDGTLTLLFATKRAYPITDTYVSSVLIGGDLQVRVSVPFTQRNWNNIWRNEPVGEQLLNKLNLKDYPMILTDDGAITERWMIKMTGANTFELYGETLGFVMRGDTLTDLMPINPAYGKPYFTLLKQAFGNEAPWASQDIIRFNTWGTLLPVWVLCAVQPSPDAPTDEDGYTQCLYGDTTEMTV